MVGVSPRGRTGPPIRDVGRSVPAARAGSIRAPGAPADRPTPTHAMTLTSATPPPDAQPRRSRRRPPPPRRPPKPRRPAATHRRAIRLRPRRRHSRRSWRSRSASTPLRRPTTCTKCRRDGARRDAGRVAGAQGPRGADARTARRHDDAAQGRHVWRRALLLRAAGRHRRSAWSVQGPASPITCVTPRDTFPPPAPQAACGGCRRRRDQPDLGAEHRGGPRRLPRVARRSAG